MLVDKEQALKMQNGDSEFLYELWKLYLEDAENKKTSFDTAYEQQDYTQIERLAHSLKSSSAVIGSEPLSQKAAHLEDLTRKNEEPEQIRQAYTDFRKSLDEVLAYLSSELQVK
ncbi:MAG: Hpt domain-containing protein [Desulfovibrionales bacterium]